MYVDDNLLAAILLYDNTAARMFLYLCLHIIFNAVYLSYLSVCRTLWISGL